MPYSDNLYSMVDDDSDSESIGRLGQGLGYHSEEQPAHDVHWDHQPETGDDVQEQVFTPTDGYFHTASTFAPSATPTTAPVSSHVPHVPNVWVRDPSLEQGSAAENKAREADREASTNYDSLNSPDGSRQPHSGSRAGSFAYTPQPSHRSSASTSSRATHYQPSVAAYTPLTTSSYTSNTRRQRPYDQRTPFLPPDAPPAYTPSPTTSPTTSPTNSSPAQTNLFRNYRTFLQPSMGREEAEGLLARHPESMGDAHDEFAGITPAWRERARCRVPYLNGRSCKMILLGLALLIVTIGFVATIITSIQEEKKPSIEDPASRPSLGDNPSTEEPDPDSGLEPPSMDYPPLDDNFSWPADRFCKDLTFNKPTQSFDLSFGSEKSLSFVQDVDKDDHTRGHPIKVCGDFVLRRSGEGTPGPSIVVQVTTNDERINPDIQFSSETQTLRVTVPRELPWGETSTWPCLRVQATVWVPADASLDTLFVQNVHLGIKLRDNLSLKIAKSTHLTSTVGTVVAAESSLENLPLEDGSPKSFNFDSRWIEVKSTSGKIKGYWPLYDYLRVQSISGDIRVGIEPKEVNKDAPKPAILYIKSMSGKIDFHEPTDKALAAALQSGAQNSVGPEKYIPPRDYRSEVQSTSGNIRGTLAFSSTCRFHSTSGDTTVDLLPVLDSGSAEGDEYASLETSSTSGHDTITVQNPLWVDASQGKYLPLPISSRSPADDNDSSAGGCEPVIPIGNVGAGDPYAILHPAPSADGQVEARQKKVAAAPAVRRLRSRHTTTSADIKIRYPASWEGDLDLNSLSGELTVHGRDVKRIRGGSDWPGVNKQILARKGAEGGSSAYFKSLSGDVDVRVG